MFRRSFLSAIMLVASRAVLGSEQSADYWRAKVAAAVAMQPLHSSATPAEKPKGEPRPIVKMYTATWCGPCQRAKAELKGVSLPFDLQFVDVSNGGSPAWCESIPAFAWEHDKQTRFILGFPGATNLVVRWQATRRQPRPAATATGYEPNWTWPGNLSRHLQAAHGINVAGMSQDQMEALHDGLHEGRKTRA